MPETTLPFVPATFWVVPFVLLLIGLAVLPLVAAHFWESNLRKLGICALLGLPVLGLYAIQNPRLLLHAGGDYVSFIVLLGSLYVIAGGVFMDGDLPATPRINTLFLGTGALIASFVGTTGASMLLIRPLLQTNQERTRVTHTMVFFIFLVSNVGGCLTPLGDPPLFLGYLVGVPFTWTFRLVVPWATTVIALLAVYFLWETREYRRELPADRREDLLAVRPLRVAGGMNLALLVGVVLATAFLEAPWREVAMALLAAASLRFTPKDLRAANRFSFGPILEVAVVFAGIFATMLPALDLLRARGGELGVREPWHFFWATGLLSSFLDNAPTYLTFVALAQGLGLRPDVVGISHEVLTAISLGAVFMGAATYIGNGPNFMVRSIAESRGVKMPSFGGYMLYSGAVLMPIFVLVTFVFLR